MTTHFPAEALLAKNSINLETTAPGRYYTTCPCCSAARSKQHQTIKCLGVTITDDTVHWGCNHCGETGPKTGANGSKPEPVSYVYRDASGEVKFRKVRNSPGREPRFWLQKPNGGGWQTGTKGVDTKIIYRADEVANAIRQGRPIVCVEGEKDADNLWRLGIVSTCNAHGASEPGKAAKWTARHSQQLRGAEIVVLNDNDAAGYAHADATCRLSVGIAARIRRLDLAKHWPDIPKGGDVSDWLDAGHGREELAELIATAPDYAEAPGEKTAEAAGTPDEVELTRLAKLPPLEYERARSVAAKALGMRASILDRLIEAKRDHLSGCDGLQGRAVVLPEPKPWDEAVDGVALADELAAATRRYVVLDDHAQHAAACWILHAHATECFLISPRLSIMSATKGCGKSTLLDVIKHLVPRPLLASNVSSSAIFRSIEKFQPTLLCDEADTYWGHQGDDSLRGILNSGHRKGGAVLRAVGQDFEPRMFSTFGACILASIKALPETLHDRSILIELRRRRSSDPNEAIAPFRFDRVKHLDVLASKAARWAQDHAAEVAAVDPDLPKEIGNRAADNWRVLKAVAVVLGGPWPGYIDAAAVAAQARNGEEASQLEQLLADIRGIGFDEIKSADLVNGLVALEGRPWAEMGKNRKPLTQNRLARLLKPLAIAPENVGPVDARVRGYRLDQFDEAFARYLDPDVVSQPHSRTECDEIRTSDISELHSQPPDCADEKFKKPNKGGVLGRCAVAKEQDGDAEPVCTVCGRPGGNSFASGDRTGWLHRECEKVFFASIESHDHCDEAPAERTCGQCSAPIEDRAVPVGGTWMHPECASYWRRNRGSGEPRRRR